MKTQRKFFKHIISVLYLISISLLLVLLIECELQYQQSIEDVLFLRETQMVDNKRRYLEHEAPTVEPPTQEYLDRQSKFLDLQKSKFPYDDKYGPLIEYPYAPETIYKDIETLTEKPGFKIWVDQGMLDYPEYSCESKMLDCSLTCCMQSYCASHKGLCINFIRRPYYEIYIGIALVVMIIVGCPTCIMFVEALLNLRFCRHKDNDDRWVGGNTICEAITYVFTCGSSSKEKNMLNIDNYVFQEIVIEESQISAEENPFPDINSLNVSNQINQEQQDILMDEIKYKMGQNFDEVNQRYQNQPINYNQQKRGCCKRILCLVCCCDTEDIGSQNHLNQINDVEIQLYQQQLKAEILRKRKGEHLGGFEAMINEELAEGEVLPIDDSKPPIHEFLESDQGSKKTQIKADS